jgi:hypothetical protein
MTYVKLQVHVIFSNCFSLNLRLFECIRSQNAYPMLKTSGSIGSHTSKFLPLRFKFYIIYIYTLLKLKYEFNFLLYRSNIYIHIYIYILKDRKDDQIG